MIAAGWPSGSVSSRCTLIPLAVEGTAQCFPACLPRGAPVRSMGGWRGPPWDLVQDIEIDLSPLLCIKEVLFVYSPKRKFTLLSSQDLYGSEVNLPLDSLG